jgi:hypothetical protein
MGQPIPLLCCPDRPPSDPALSCKASNPDRSGGMGRGVRETLKVTVGGVVGWEYP